jgi:TRAP-type C4-dicarboxylate transport system permease large subunit
MQKNNFLVLAGLLFLATFLSSCEAIGNIFKAGVWTGLLLVAVVVAIIVWIVAKARKK